ncbi:unnamed protein product, partial [marine sediment metagenome]
FNILLQLSIYQKIVKTQPYLIRIANRVLRIT